MLTYLYAYGAFETIKTKQPLSSLDVDVGTGSISVLIIVMIRVQPRKQC